MWHLKNQIVAFAHFNKLNSIDCFHDFQIFAAFYMLLVYSNSDCQRFETNWTSGLDTATFRNGPSMYIYEAYNQIVIYNSSSSMYLKRGFINFCTTIVTNYKIQFNKEFGRAKFVVCWPRILGHWGTGH